MSPATERLALRPPCCGRLVWSAPLLRSATFVGRRTCPACRSRWLVVVKPLPAREGLLLHEATWKPLPTPPRRG